jgi:hypothetical protein
LINHVALVLDASYSMNGKERAVTKVTDEQIKHLALRSEELNQETRVSVYRFGEQTIECLIFDMDVMRLPSANDLYSVLRENTSLIDATLKSQDDLATTSQLYGDHAFLTFVLTDGEENRSKNSPGMLQRRLAGAPDNWSIGFLVPDNRGVAYMERLGVLRDSIAVWDITGTAGLHTAASKIRTATDNFMQARASGVRGTKNVFSTGVENVNTQTVSANLDPIPAGKYSLHKVTASAEIRDFIIRLGVTYKKGIGYYQLTKTETIQANKQIVVVDKKTGVAYTGAQARALLGLPSTNIRVRPNQNPLYDIFVQSTSVNRKLVPNTKLLILT